MENELVLKVQGLDLAKLPPISYNKAEIEAYVAEMEERFKGRVYTPESVKNAKSDRAEINNAEKRLGEACTALKKGYTQNVTTVIDEVRPYRERLLKLAAGIDEQVKAVEEGEKADKRAKLADIYAVNIGAAAELIPFEKLLDPKWLNKTFAFSNAEKALLTLIEEKKIELDQLKELCSEGEEYTACLRVYLNRLDLKAAIAERQNRRAFEERKRKAEAARQAEEEAKRAAPYIQPPTPEQREIKEQAARNVQMSQIMDENGRLDMDALRPAPQPKTWTKTLRVTYTAEQGKRLVAALNEIGIEYELI